MAEPRRWTGPEKWRCDVCQFQLEETGTRGDVMGSAGGSRNPMKTMGFHGI